MGLGAQTGVWNQDTVSLSCVSSGVDLVWCKSPTKIKILRN